jgi:hypothetical protein
MTYGNFREIIDSIGGVHLREQKPPAEKWGTLKPKAYLWVGRQNKEIMVFSELLDKAIQSFKISL